MNKVTEIITLDDDDDFSMDQEQKDENECSTSGGLIRENLSFSDFTPFSMTLQEEEDFENDNFDPTEEIDFDDEAAESRYVNNPYNGGIKASAKFLYSYPKDESVNEILNSLPEKFKWERLRDLLPEDFVKKFGGKDAAFKELTYDIQEMRKKHTYEGMIEIILDFAKKAGASEADIQQIRELPFDVPTNPDNVPITSTIKREIWDGCVEEAIKTTTQDSIEDDIIDEERGDDEKVPGAKTKESISVKPEPEYIEIDD